MSEIPQHTFDALARYLDRGLKPGAFLLCVLDNDLRGAVMNADEENRLALPALIEWMEESVPSAAWGSAEAVDAWLDQKSRPVSTFPSTQPITP